jgi:hypothetical protein
MILASSALNCLPSTSRMAYGVPERQHETILVSSTVLMWQSAELWCLPSWTMSRWYRLARVGSMRRAQLASMKRASRSGASPDLVGAP